MDRQTALRVLGLEESAGPAEIVASYRALRAHVERRAQASADEGFRAARRAELRQLDEALRAVAGENAPTGGARRWTAAVAALVGAAVIGAGALWWLGWLGPQPAEPSADATPPIAATEEPPAPEPGPPARLSVLANVEGAVARVWPEQPAPGEEPETEAPAGQPEAEAEAEGGAADPASETGVAALPAAAAAAAADPALPEPLLSVPADGESHELPAGAYRVEVAHPDCPDPFEQEIALESGEARQLDARTCESTGWAVVRSNLSGDRLTIDGRPYGSTGPSPVALAAGEHTFRVEKRGFLPWQAQAEVRPGEYLTLRANLRRQRQARAPEPEPEPASAARAATDGGPGYRAVRGGTHDWFDLVGSWMVAQYDSDDSGRIDREVEVAAISCDVWQEVERSYETGGLGAPMSRLYGFDGSRWVEGALGFDLPMRSVAFERMKGCGLR